MKTALILFFCISVCLSPSCSNAEADKAKPADPPSAAAQFWEGLKNDWKQIGRDTKNSGEKIGRTVSGEVKQVPEDVRKGFEETKRDFKKLTGQSESDN